MADKFRFGVVGVGPTGGAMAARLADAGHSVVLVDVLKEHMDHVREHGLNLTGIMELTARFDPEDVCYCVDELHGKKSMDYLFVAVKASVMAAIIPTLAKVLKPGTTVISLQNGMDTEKVLAETFGYDNVLRMVVNYAGNIIDKGKIRCSFFNPPNYIGVINPNKRKEAEKLARVLTAARMDTEFAPDIQKRVWIKVILNCGLSAMCALTRKTMKQMMDFKATRSLVEDVLRESVTVAEEMQVELPEGFLDTCMGYLDKAGHHQTSMHIDIELQNPSEIDFLNGKIVEYGQMCGIETPFNSTIVRLIKGTQLEVLPGAEHA
ncbi:MAG: 2-dehydropantoate 2-reductase [Candidatus Eisenbacteria bacterium]